jgi:30S ribosomal protein S31
MGKGDKRSKKGKIWRHSFGNSRPKVKGKILKLKVKPAAPAEPAAK